MSARNRSVALSIVLAGLLAGCSGPGLTVASSTASPTTSPAAPVAPSSDPSGGTPVSLTVFAAASLKQAFTDIGTAYEASDPGTRVTFSFDASSALETQIEQGAPADVFASADTKNPQKLIDGGFAAGSMTVFAANLLTVIVPSSNPAGVSSPADLARSGLKVVAAGDDVPITRYANQLLANLARQTGYPTDFAARVTANIVSKEDNVAAVVAKIELGEGDAAIVYATDARSSTKVATVAVPDAANVRASYGAVAVKASRNAAAAAAFIAWLAGPDGQAILARSGFLPPS